MPKASEVAMELRKLADSLDTQPELEVVRPWMMFCHYTKEEKESFKALAKLMPRPLTKKVCFEDFYLEHRTAGLDLSAKIPQSVTCTLVEPAKPAVYDCDPILSDAEFEAV